VHPTDSSVTGAASWLKACRLCPRHCGIDRSAGQTGFCGAGRDARIALVSLHQWEEPCLSGDRGSGTVFFSRCNLRCVFCQNHAISQSCAGKEVSADRLGEIFLEQQTRGAHNLNLVSPTPYVPQILAAMTRARARGFTLPVVYNTNSYETPATVGALAGHVDIYLPDLKYVDPAIAVQYSAAPDYFLHAAKAIEAMVEQAGPPVFGNDGLMRRGVIIRHLLLPGLVEDSKRVVDYVRRTFGDAVYLSLMSQYTPVYRAAEYPQINRTIDPAEYTALVDYALSLGLNNGYVQEGGAAKESFIPQFDMRGV
jgi:putative pyruvate formate lyase activating enzyme